jgi:hypothetical protein
MYRKIKLLPTLLILFTLNLFNTHIYAQFSLSGQVRVRGEHRAGFANLIPETDDAANFISQRTRLNFGYKWDRLTFGASIQDVRVWGQDASSLSPVDGNKLMLHEGWADITLLNRTDSTIKIKFLDNLSLKIGRQELIYDDSRLIGNLDWMQQGRRFDMALLKAVHHGWHLDLGYAFNQNGENFSNEYYAPGNIPAYIKNNLGELVPVPAQNKISIIPLLDVNGKSSKNGTPNFTNAPSTNGATQDYKNFVSVYVSKKFNQTKVSALYFQDNFGKYQIDSANAGANGGKIYYRNFNLKGTSDRYTYGAMVLHTIGNGSGFGKIDFTGAFYKQSGLDRDGKNLDAYHYTAQAYYSKGNFTIGPGYDYLSGDEKTTGVTETKRFDPLYGTPHKFWGLMDYFYAPTGSPKAGLVDAYFKSKFAANRYSIALDYHYFEVANEMAATPEKKLGDEVDLTLCYNLNKFTTIDAGYSVMKGTDAMPYAKSQVTPALPSSTFNKTGQFGYLSINVKPDFLFNKSVANSK